MLCCTSLGEGYLLKLPEHFITTCGRSSVWLEHLVWGQEVTRSNRVVRTGPEGSTSAGVQAPHGVRHKYRVEPSPVL